MVNWTWCECCCLKSLISHSVFLLIFRFFRLLGLFALFLLILMSSLVNGYRNWGKIYRNEDWSWGWFFFFSWSGVWWIWWYNYVSDGPCIWEFWVCHIFSFSFSNWPCIFSAQFWSFFLGNMVMCDLLIFHRFLISIFGLVFFLWFLCLD